MDLPGIPASAQEAPAGEEPGTKKLPFMGSLWWNPKLTAPRTLDRTSVRYGASGIHNWHASVRGKHLPIFPSKRRRQTVHKHGFVINQLHGEVSVTCIDVSIRLPIRPDHIP